MLRGIGSDTTSIGLEQSVAVIVDGVYYGQGRTISEGFIDLGRLEILKGPQALFFGERDGRRGLDHRRSHRHARGDRARGLRIPHAAEYGEVVVSGPVSDTLGFRVAVRGSKMDDGYFENIGTPQVYPTRDRTSTAQIVNPTNHPVGVAGDGAGKEIYIRGTLR
ncbi:MAG: hypothetical protein U1F11_16345 [Steroidobacteraceae bacterium]